MPGSFEGGACDGFMIMPAYLPGDMELVVGHVASLL
jgi:hypothetical protein